MVSERGFDPAISARPRPQAARGEADAPRGLQRPAPAGQDDDLELLGGARQDLEHLLDPLIVGEHERVVQDDDRRPALIGEQLGEGQAGKNRQLLTRALAQALEGFKRAGAADRGDPEHIVDLELGAGKQRLQIGPHPAQDRSDIPLLGVALGVPQDAQEQVQRLDLAPVSAALARQLVEPAPCAPEALLQAAAGHHLDPFSQALERQLALPDRGRTTVHRPAQPRHPLLEIFERFLGGLLPKPAQMRLGAPDLALQLADPGRQVGRIRRRLDGGQLGAKLLEPALRLRQTGGRLATRGRLAVAVLDRGLQLTTRRAQLGDEVADPLLRLGERGLDRGGVWPGRGGSRRSKPWRPRRLAPRRSIPAPAGGPWGSAAGGPKPRARARSGGPHPGGWLAGAAASATTGRIAIRPTPSIAIAIGSTIRSELPASLQRAAIDPYPRERRGLDLEGDLARGRLERRPTGIALPDRLRKALEATLVDLGLVEDRLRALELGGPFARQGCRRLRSGGRIGQGDRRLLAFGSRVGQLFGQCPAPGLICQRLVQLDPPGLEVGLGLARWRALNLEPVAAQRELVEL